MRRAVLLALALAGVVHAATFLGSGPFDDDFICYRYARNWVEGNGLVFNPGERYEGFTNPLWVMILALGLRLRLDPEVVSLGLSMLSVGVAAWAAGAAWTRRHPGSRFPLPALLVAASPAIAWHGVAGLGTTLLAALLALWFLDWERAREVGRPAWRAGVWLFLACLLRQEAALFALPFLVVERRAPALLPLAALAGWTAFRLAYYGRWLPITFAAKKLPLAADLGYGTNYLLLSTLEAGVGVALLLATFATRVTGRRRATTRAAVTAVLLHGLYVLLVGGDFVAYARFFVPTLPLAYLFACEGACAFVTHPARRLALGVTAVAALSWTQVGALVPIGRAVVGVGRTYRFQDHGWNEARWRVMGEHLGAVLPPGTRVALSPIGVFGWTSRLWIVDPLGLTNDSVLDEEPMLDQVSMKGHHRIDPDWVLAQRPDVVILGNGRRDPFNGKPSVNPWEAPLVFHPTFQRDYQRWIVPLPEEPELDVWVLRGSAIPPGARAPSSR